MLLFWNKNIREVGKSKRDTGNKFGEGFDLAHERNLHSYSILLHSCLSMKSQKTTFKLDVKKSSAGLGLFAGEVIKKGSKIIEYIGNKITAEEANRRGGKYLFEINSRWTIDGTNRKNIARYINHACKPNCEAEIRSGRIWILAKKDIALGEELTYDYGEEYVDEYIKPLGCRCFSCTQQKLATA